MVTEVAQLIHVDLVQMGGQAVDLGFEGVDLLLVVRLRNGLCHRPLCLGQKPIRLQIGPADLSHLFHHRLGNRFLLDGVAGADPCFGEPLVGPADEIQPVLPRSILPVEHRQRVAALVAENHPLEQKVVGTAASMPAAVD